VRYLNNGYKFPIGNKDLLFSIKSVLIQNEEVIRILTRGDNIITLFSIINEKPYIKNPWESKSKSVFINSEDSDEIAELSDGILKILKINEKHEFFIAG
jgi:hypothetical protein